MKISILNEKGKKCSVFNSLKIDRICLFDGFRVFVGLMMVASNAQIITISVIFPQIHNMV